MKAISEHQKHREIKGITYIDLWACGVQEADRLEDSIHSFKPPQVEAPRGIDMLCYFHLYQSDSFAIRYSYRRYGKDMTKIFDIGVDESGRYYAICIDMSPYAMGNPFPFKYLFNSKSELDVIKIVLAFSGKQLTDMAEQALIKLKETQQLNK